MSGKLDAAVVEQHRGLVTQVATQTKRRYRLGIDLDDLLAAGVEGLLQAQRTYDPTRGINFSTFAFYRIRGAILDDCRRLGLIRRQYSRRARFEAAANDVLAEAAEIEPAPDDGPAATRWIGGTFDSLAAAYELSQCEVREARQTAADPERRAVGSQLQRRLRAHLETLSSEEREVIEAYYFRGERMTIIGDRFGLSKSWVSRVHTRALKKLRPLMDEPAQEDDP